MNYLLAYICFLRSGLLFNSSKTLNYFDITGDEKMMQEMKTMMADFVRMEAETQQYVAALNHVKSMVSRVEYVLKCNSICDVNNLT